MKTKTKLKRKNKKRNKTKTKKIQNNNDNNADNSSLKAALWRLAALDQRFVKLLNCTAKEFDPLAAAACDVDPSVSAVLGAPNLDDCSCLHLPTVFRFVIRFCRTKQFSTVNSSICCSWQFSDRWTGRTAFEAVQVPVASTVQFSYPVSICWCWSTD